MGDLFLSPSASEGNEHSLADEKHTQICGMFARAHRLEAEAWRLKAEAYRLCDESEELIGHCLHQSSEFERVAELKEWLGSISAHEAEQRRFSGPPTTRDGDGGQPSPERDGRAG